MTSGNKCNLSYNQGQYSDLLQLYDGRIVIDDGHSFDVHKVILAACSPFFRSLFCGLNCEMTEHRISNINRNSMNEILSYIYTNDVCITEININDLLVAADKFFLEDLKLELTKCVKTTLTDDNCLKLCCTAYQINQNEILQNCITYIERRFQNIMKNQKKDLIYLPQEVLKNILNSRNLNTESERNVWQAIIYWIEADTESRLKDLPCLLTTLAVDEIGKDFATEIINHDIVVNNLHIKPLIDTCTKSFDDFGRDDQFLKRLLQICSNDLPLKNFRIPRKLNVMAYYKTIKRICEIYISYDETLDLWRKITETEYFPRYLEAIGWNIFFLSEQSGSMLSFDTRTLEQKTIEQLQGMLDLDPFLHVIVTIRHHMYIFVTHRHNSITCIHVYDTIMNTVFHYELCNKRLIVKAAAIRENIFVVGVDEDSSESEMIALVFNSVTRRHTFIPKPNVFRHGFSLVAYHENIYLIGRYNRLYQDIQNVEVFNPAENLWKELPAVPISASFSSVHVFNDQLLFVYDKPMEDGNPLAAARWNELEECWEELEKSKFHENYNGHRLYSIDDTEQIQFQTKQNRKSDVQLKISIPFKHFLKLRKFQ